MASNVTFCYHRNMNPLIWIIIGIWAVSAFLFLGRKFNRRHYDQNMKLPLIVYVKGVVIVLAVIIAIAWLAGGSARAAVLGHFAIAFLLGMLAMYIAVHIYKYK